MRATYTPTDGEEQTINNPGESSVWTGDTCPRCHNRRMSVTGDSPRVVGDRYYSSRARCVDCNAIVGELRAYPDTLFGIEEDQRVLNGRCRVY